jgi:hypothetical protein
MLPIAYIILSGDCLSWVLADKESWKRKKKRDYYNWITSLPGPAGYYYIL